jgi:hypothetical protein
MTVYLKSGFSCDGSCARFFEVRLDVLGICTPITLFTTFTIYPAVVTP